MVEISYMPSWAFKAPRDRKKLLLALGTCSFIRWPPQLSIGKIDPGSLATLQSTFSSCRDQAITSPGLLWLSSYPCPPHRNTQGPSKGLTNLGPLWGNPGHSWGALGQPGDSPFWNTQGIATGGIAENGQADLLLSNGGLRGLALSGQCLLVPRCLLIQQVADLHDVADDFHWACEILLPGWQVILGFL